MSVFRVILVVAVIAAVLLPACSSTAPSAPSRRIDVAPQPTPTPTPTSAEVIGRWAVTARLTTVSGDSCATEAVRSLMNTVNAYSVVVTRTSTSTAQVNLVSASGEYDCSFGASLSDEGFTTAGISGTYSCRKWWEPAAYRCADGKGVELRTFGQDISGTFSGDEIIGRWDVDWVQDWTTLLATSAELKGHRQ